MRFKTVVIASGLVILGVLSAASAEVVPGRWEKVDSLTRGTGIIVSMTGGDRMECEFISSDPEGITVVDSDQSERTLPKSGVKKIQTIAKTGKNRVWDGALIGAAIGAAAGGITVAAVGTDDDSGNAAGVLLATGIGAGVGLGVDAAVGARETLYVAP